MRGIGKAVRLIIAVAVAAYLAAAGYLFLVQRDHVFQPSGALADPAALGLVGVEIVNLIAKDGTSLTGWYIPAAPGKPTLLYFHGNAGNVSERAPRFRQVALSGFGVLAMSYRGFAGSGGSPTETALFSDALETFDWLAARSDSVVLHGELLGTAIATYVAAERPAAALVLEAPFSAVLDIAAATYPWLPVSLLMRDPFLSRDHIRRVDEPVMILHGTADRVIPVQSGRRLFEAADEPKELVIVDGAGHLELWKRGLWPIVLDFLMKNGVVGQAEPVVRRMPSLAG